LQKNVAKNNAKILQKINHAKILWKNNAKILRINYKGKKPIFREKYRVSKNNCKILGKNFKNPSIKTKLLEYKTHFQRGIKTKYKNRLKND